MTIQIDYQLFSRVELFDNLTSEQLLEVLGTSDELVVLAGRTIYEAGHVERALYVLLSGTVEVDVSAPRAGERVLAELSPGSVFGESSFFHASPHSATVRALADARLIRIDRESFDKLLAEGNIAALRIAANASRILAERLQQADRFIVELLESIEDRKIHESWAKFRSAMGHSFGSSGASVGVGMAR
jgi:CRP/FNR family cyclic AMP-dependent transcriptional regulator